jgi:hypothetical protein
MNDETILAILQKHFGPDASIEPMLFGGWRISTRTGGEVEFTGEKFENIIGGSDVYRGVVGAGSELWGGTISVDGPSSHILTALAHGDDQGVIIQPTIKDATSGCLKFLAVVAIFGISAGIASAHMGGWQSLALGAVVAGGVMSLINPSWNKAANRAARRRGQKYLDAFPQVHGSDRVANRDAARDKGLL